MTNAEIARQRLTNHRIAHEKFDLPSQVVTSFGAMQAQDYASAKWAIGLRCAAATETTINQAVADRTIMPSWLMRGTLHVVAAAIVEHVIEAQSWLDDCVRLLAPFEVFFVGVHCSLGELERRERARGDRSLGEGRSHLEDGVHTWGVYDFEVDTSLRGPDENARLILAALAHKPQPSAFRRMAAQRNEP